MISYVLGVAAGLSNVAVLLYWQRRRELPVVFGIPLLGGGPFSPPDRIPFFGSALVVAHAADAVAGQWLWRSRRRGGFLGLALTPVALVFAYGFELPYLFITAPLRAALIAAGWRSLRD